MYICSCNVFTDHDVRAVAREANHRVPNVYRCLGCSPECGRCAATIRKILAGLEGVTESPFPEACPMRKAHADVAGDEAS